MKWNTAALIAEYGEDLIAHMNEYATNVKYQHKNTSYQFRVHGRSVTYYMSTGRVVINNGPYRTSVDKIHPTLVIRELLQRDAFTREDYEHGKLRESWA